VGSKKYSLRGRILQGFKQDNSVLFRMAWPIVVELIVNGFIANLNQVIINGFSSDALATIGSGSQILVLIINLYAIVSVGVSIVLAQAVGGKRYEETGKIINAALVMNLVLGIVISLIGILSIPLLLRLIHMPKELENLSKQYLLIAIGFSFIQAILNTLIAVFRSFGYMKQVTITLISVNILNLLFTKLVSICIPETSQNLMQYAITGVIAQSIGIFLFLRMLCRDKVISFTLSIKEGFINSRELISRILRLGIPGGMEGIIYLISQTIVVGFIGMLGTQAMFTKAIVGNVTYYMCMATATITTAAGAIIGQLIGAGKIEEVKLTCKKNIKLTIGITIPLCIIFLLFGQKILRIYSNDIAVINMGIKLLLLSAFMEIARGVAANMITALKAVGDVDFPFMIIIIASIINVIISYYLGIIMKMGLSGIWIGYIAELILRAVASLIRWKKGKWENIALYYIREKKDTCI
jgi:putative MATE family efflux protein